MVEYGADTWNLGKPKNNFSYLQNLHISTPLEEKLLTEETTRHTPSHAEPIEEKEKENNAQLLAQMPASRVPRNPRGNNRQERKDAVSGRKTGIVEQV